jgi:hypothetical protein
MLPKYCYECIIPVIIHHRHLPYFYLNCLMLYLQDYYSNKLADGVMNEFEGGLQSPCRLVPNGVANLYLKWKI